jgi:hypothetical protein
MHAATLSLLMPLFNCLSVCSLQSGTHTTSLSLVHDVNGVITCPFTCCINDSGFNSCHYTHPSNFPAMIHHWPWLLQSHALLVQSGGCLVGGGDR